MSLTFVFTIITFFLPLSTAHVGMYSYSMFGRCGSNNQCINQGEPAQPLRGLPFNEWWFHNYLDFPPPSDAITELPAGQSVILQLAGNSAFTDVGQKGKGAFWPGGAGKGEMNESIENDPKYWSDGRAGNLHTYGLNDVAGCALSIAYTDKATDVRPEDFVVFSVQHTCVWHRDTVFEVPADMPPCPNGKCICSWWWIHNSNSGTDQIYQTGFQCNVTHSSGQKISTTPIGKPVPPVNCENDPSKCVKGPKMPMYWMQAECNNMFEPGHKAPTYNDRYGFGNGAQNDIFQTVAESNYSCPQSKARSSTLPSPLPSSAPSSVSSPAPSSLSSPAPHKKSTVPLRHKQAKRRALSG